MNDRAYCLIGMKSIPPRDIRESLFLKNLRKRGHMQEHVAPYKQGVAPLGKQRDYDALLSIVKTHVESRRPLRNRENMERGHH
eukprot:1738695-Karenia_brevis.AAC.1